MSDWWAKKLGQPEQPARVWNQPPQRATPPITPPERTYQQAQGQDIEVNVENVFEATKVWQGGEANRKGIGNCPNCNSHLYFSRTNTGTVVTQNGAATPAPRCYSCGFTEGRQMQGLPT